MTTLADVQDQIQKYWSPIFTKQLRESLLLGGLVNKQYQGEIKKGGDTVRVSQVNAPNGQLLTIGTDADSFAAEAISTTYVDIKADKRAVAAYEFEDVVSLQSQIDADGSEAREALLFAMNKQINNYLYSLVSPSSATPDHVLGSVATLDAAQLAAIRLLASQAMWRQEGGWYGVVDPAYYGQIMTDATLASVDKGAGDRSIIAGQVGEKKLGFTILEDNSRTAKSGLFFHPDFMHLVMQSQVQIKVSDLHAQKKFGVLMSVDVIFGAKLGIEGSKKHISVAG